MKALARWIFAVLARLVLRRYQPVIVGVAGSIGKTATKEAIAAALDRGHGSVRKTIGSFNAEIGVPTTIITGGAARQRWWQWLGVIWHAKKLIFFRRRSYPQYVVLELGADKPGDMTGLLKIARPQVGVLTAITPEHLEFFGDMDTVVNEESQILTDLPAEGRGVVNADDPNAEAAARRWGGALLRYGWSASADVRATQEHVHLNHQGLPTGFECTVTVGSETEKISIDGVIGKHQAYPLLAAIAVGHALGQSLQQSVEGLRGYQPPPGRMRLLEGIEGTLLIDDSYNSSPAAVQAALEALYKLKIPGRKFVVLGQMSELGGDAAVWHDRIGERISPARVETLITVGPLADRIGQAAKKKKFPSNRIVNVPTAESAAVQLRPLIRGGDVILLKGSRYASRLEKAVRILLANPARDRSKLVDGISY